MGDRYGSQQSAIPPELLALVASLGIDAATLGGQSSSEPPVFMGSTRPSGFRPSVGDDPRNVRSRRTPARDVIRTADQAVGEFYTWTDDELTYFQERAFTAGLYGTDDRRDVRFGDPTDSATFSIWAGLVDAAAGFYAADRKISPYDALDLAARGASAQGDTGPARAPLVVELDNPESVKRLMREAAREALGSGKVDDARLDDIIARWHAEQRESQTAQYNAAETGGTVTAPPDFETFAGQEARNLDPKAYDARKVVGAADFLARKLRGEVA